MLWVDENGVTDRGKAVIAEIEKADDYGLRASDYVLPKADAFDVTNANAAEWLADAEIKISYAVLDYARDARGGRIAPSRLSANLDPALVLPNPTEVMESIVIRSDPAAYLRSFQPDQPQFEALRQKLLELRGGKTETPKQAVEIPDGPVLTLGIEHEQVALLRKRLDMPSKNPDGTPAAERHSTSRSPRRYGASSSLTALRPMASSGPVQGACSITAGSRVKRASRRKSGPCSSIWSVGAGCPTISANST